MPIDYERDTRVEPQKSDEQPPPRPRRSTLAAEATRAATRIALHELADDERETDHDVTSTVGALLTVGEAAEEGMIGPSPSDHFSRFPELKDVTMRTGNAARFPELDDLGRDDKRESDRSPDDYGF